MSSTIFQLRAAAPARPPAQSSQARQERQPRAGSRTRLLDLELTHLAVDGCITKASYGRQTAGPSPVDRAKQGRQTRGPLPAHPIVHLDAGYDWKLCHDELAARRWDSRPRRGR
jgi:hypothetical protein